MNIKKFIKERDEILLSGDLDRMVTFYQKHNPGRSVPARDVVEIAFHKARTGATSLPREIRMESKRWLNERGLGSLDDGDLNDA